jgi:hypothetical protein
LFWAGGLVLYLLKNGWQDPWKRLSGLQLIEQLALLIVCLLGLILSSFLMKSLRFTILRLLEGYWPLVWPAAPLVKLQACLLDRREKRWNELGQKKTLSPAEKRELSSLDLKNHYFPADPADIQPTALGNLLRAAETAPRHKYGLDAFVCWPRLWLLLPDNAREDLSAARQGLMRQVELWAWGLLFLSWAALTPWALLATALWLWLAGSLLMHAAMTYADLLEAAFDLYRGELYQFMRWSLPEAGGEAEITNGKRLTEFLWRGTGHRL